MTPTLHAFAGAFAHRPALFLPTECARWVRDIYQARPFWTGNFADTQFTLGRAWYTHLEEEQADDYFAHAAESDALVQRVVPGLQERMLGLLSQLVGAPVERRVDWCGPGVHIFPAAGRVATQGGEVHFDSEGLSDEALADDAAALTVVAMLQAPAFGGGLRVWDRRCTSSEEEQAALAEADRLPSRVADYGIGDVVAIDSRRLHQIQPFSGALDRISATAHVVLERGHWQAWF